VREARGRIDWGLVDVCGNSKFQLVQTRSLGRLSPWFCQSHLYLLSSVYVEQGFEGVGSATVSNIRVALIPGRARSWACKTPPPGGCSPTSTSGGWGERGL
jgi:hypothetical protein